MTAAAREALLLGALSAVVLALEVFDTRLVAYAVPLVLVYAVLGIALLGFGAAGSLVATRPEWRADERRPAVLAAAALVFAATIVLGHALFVRVAPFLHGPSLTALLLSGLLALPYLAAGVVVTVALSAAGPRLGLTYAADLVGSGLGCFVPIVLLGPLVGEGLLALLAAAACACGFGWYLRVPSPPPWLRYLAVAASLLVAVAAAAPLAVFPIQPEPTPSGQLAGQYQGAREGGYRITKVFDRWNATGRVEIVQFHDVPGAPNPYPALFFAQDSSAGSTLFRWDGRDSSQVRPGAEDPGTDISRLCTETLYGQGYFSERPRVLVIGLGGGPDVQCALYHRAREVSVAEINPDAVRAVQGRFSAWLGGIGTDPRVTVHLQDGRSFLETALRRGAAPWDLIQLSGVDTKASLASGALSMSENHLYTVEALETALRLLAPDGAVSVIRFTEAEALRLSVTAFEALRRLGAAEPHRHVAVFHTGLVVGVVVRRSPFTAPDAQRLDAQLRPPWHRGVHVFYYSDNGAPFETMAAVDHLPHVSRQGRVGSLFDAAEAGELAAFVARQPEAITAASDDRPFFFDTLRHDRAESWAEPWVVALRDVLLGVVALSAALVLWPLRRLAASPGRRLSAATFVGLGAGYLLVEVWLFQQLTRFLGHPVYSLSVVLATLLVSTGLGALATLGSGQPAAPRRAAWALIFALGWLVACALLLPALLGLAWASSFPVRVALAVACLAPLGAALGVPFVTVLATIRARDAAAVPWFVGLNGFASVVASVAVVPLSMLFGYRVVLGTGIAAYAVALAGCWSLGRPR